MEGSFAWFTHGATPSDHSVHQDSEHSDPITTDVSYAPRRGAETWGLSSIHVSGYVARALCDISLKMLTLTADYQRDLRAGSKPTACASQSRIRTDDGLTKETCAARTHTNGHNHVVWHMHTNIAANTAKDQHVQLDNSTATIQ